jgi:hypothetical protein
MPALSRLCPVNALATWLESAQLTQGPVFRRVTRWGTLGSSGLDVDSVIPLLRRILADAGVDEARAYSSHSLRRGLAGWATANGWDLKTLMQYVGWKDIQTAARYVDAMPDDRSRIERGLAQNGSAAQTAAPAAVPPATKVILEVSLKLSSYAGKTRGLAAARRHIEEICLARRGGQPFGKDGTRYQISLVRETSEASLAERVGDLLDELHEIASHNECYLEASVRDPDSGQVWD